MSMTSAETHFRRVMSAIPATSHDAEQLALRQLAAGLIEMCAELEKRLQASEHLIRRLQCYR